MAARAEKQTRVGVAAIALWVVTVFAACAPLEGYAKADALTKDVVAPEWLRYVDADATLTADQKARRHRTAESWEARIREAGGR